MVVVKELEFVVKYKRLRWGSIGVVVGLCMVLVVIAVRLAVVAE